MYWMNRAIGAFDRTHNFQLGLTAAPFGPGGQWAKSGMSRVLLGGWQVNGILSRYSGLPCGVGPQVLPSTPPELHRARPQVKRARGNLGRHGARAVVLRPGGTNILRGPGVTNLDPGLFREFSATEKLKIQFRAEASNFTNTPHFNNPGTNVSNMTLNADGMIKSRNGYTEITNAQPDERQIRLGLRLSC
jgi:hypothetical protein